MPELLITLCRTCQAEYAIPDAFRGHIEGRALFCPECRKWWIAVRARTGPPVLLVDGRPVKSKADLRRYRRSGPSRPSTSKGVTDTSDVTGTISVPVHSEPNARLSLRIIISGGGKEVKGVFDLGEHRFLIGRSGCHLNLSAAVGIPDRAIEVQARPGGFTVSSIGGFPIPTGSVAIVSAQILSGKELDLELAPYRVRLAVSSTPGKPIKALDDPPQPHPATGPSTAPPIVRPSARPPIQRPTATASTDLRMAVQELAADVESSQRAFGGAGHANGGSTDLDLDQTITDIGAAGFQAMRSGNPLDGLAIRLVKLDSPAQGEVFKVTKSPILVGRTDGDLIIRDPRVSSKHAQIEVIDWRVYTVKDLASTNGTTVDDRPISTAHLKTGEVISFGGVRFEFVAERLRH